MVVTGGLGFIGSRIVDKALERGYEVVVVDNLSRARRLPDRRTCVCDVRDVDEVMRVVEPGDVILHLAALISVEESAVKPLLYEDVNSRGTMCMLEVARRRDASQFVYASSAAVYGEPEYLPIDEGHPTRPKSVYGATKLAGELFCQAYAKTYGLSAAILRLFNVYGEAQDSGVISTFASRIALGEPIKIYGDGKQERDFVYVSDVAEAFLLAVEKGAEGVYNVGSGKPTKIIELAKAMMKIWGVEVPIIFEPPRADDIRHSYGDITKIAEELGWKPKTDLNEGLKKIKEFFPISLPGRF